MSDKGTFATGVIRPEDLLSHAQIRGNVLFFFFNETTLQSFPPRNPRKLINAGGAGLFQEPFLPLSLPPLMMDLVCLHIISFPAFSQHWANRDMEKRGQRIG